RRRRFVVDFAGDKLAAAKPPEIVPNLWASNNGISNVRLIPGAGGKVTRVVFDLDTGNESLIELRLNLKNGDTPLTETWLYRWTS
ncbi:MAG TPA: glucan biosynthesis protein, partial [Beijerinckiaceae bacterium]|nr:glucan biosynthesis protein [Beijerinckiaceae bacterium]